MEKRGERARRTSTLAPFVGRSPSLAEIRRAFAEGHRLVTVVGPPGIGKTRLALRYAELEAPAEKTIVVDTSRAAGGLDVVQALRRALGLRGTPVDFEGAMIETGDALAALEERLVIVDDFERALPAGAEAMGLILERAPKACALVTSRQRLSIPGEAIVELGPMDRPTQGMDDRAVVEVESVALFLTRAHAVGGDRAADLDATVLAELVRRLEGNPLAIELAAAQARFFAPAELLDRIGDAVGSRLETSIAGSYRSLTREEREALEALSVFASDFSLDAAEAVMNGGNQGLALIQSLQDKSLVRTLVSPRTKRFALYQSIRDFAAARLRERDERKTEVRALHYLGQRGERAYALHSRTGDRAAIEWLRLEKENLRALRRKVAAYRDLTRAERVDLARTVLSLAPTLGTEGAADEWEEVLESGIAAAENDVREPALLAGLVLARATTLGLAGRHREALEDLDRALAISRRARDTALEAEIQLQRCVRYRMLGDFDASRAASRAGFELTKGTDAVRILGMMHAVTGLLLLELGELEDAKRHNERARSILRAFDPWSEAFAIANLAQIAQSEGAFDRAEKGYEQALRVFREEGDFRYEARYLGVRAGLEHERGALERARTLYEEATSRLALLKMTPSEGLFRAGLAALLADLGEIDEARLAFEDAALIAERGPKGPLLVCLDLHQGHLALAEAKAGSTRRGPGPLDHELSERLRRSASAAAHSESVRFARRLLERALAARSVEDHATRLARADLVLGEGAVWFRTKGGKRIDLSRKAADRRILDALARERHRAAGTPMSVAAILASGWPGERVLDSAGSVRVRVAIAGLRRAGLKNLLLTRGDGYLLDPDAAIVSDIARV